MYEVYTNVTVGGPNIFTCQPCASPCLTCGDNKTDCLTCEETPIKYLWYEGDHTCYEEIIWYFPFVGAAFLIIFLVWLVDCCFSETNILHSIVFFLCFVEDACMGYLFWKFLNNEVPGDRSLI